jgi:4-amino-4-deoxy-L-arabinose transferase-like glycosyltransferase
MARNTICCSFPKHHASRCRNETSDWARAMLKELFPIIDEYLDRVVLKNHQWIGLLLGVIFSVAIGLRATVPNIDRQIVAGDEETYHFSALNLIHHHTFTRDVTGEMFNGKTEVTPTANLSPGFPIYIAAIYGIFGEDTKNVLLSNIILSIISFWLIYRILKELRASPVGLMIALTVAAIYPGFLYNTDRMLTEQLFMTLFLWAIHLFLRGAEHQRPWVLAASGVVLAAATHVRAQAVPFVVLGIVYLAIYKGNRPNFTKQIASFAGGFCFIMAPWWIRNYFLLGGFIPLTEATNGPQIWGAVPYFLDMDDTAKKSLSDVVDGNFLASPGAYIRWRLFGYMNNMWGDVWDENLTHPGILLQRAAFISQIIFVVPATIAMPWLIKKHTPPWTLIATIPLIIVLPNIIFHGLPRYAFLAVPYVIIMIGLLLTKNERFTADGLTNWQFQTHRFGHIFLMVLSFFYAVWIAYSVYVFPSAIPTDMSSYRIGKYAKTSIADLSDSDIAFDETYKSSQLEVWNSKTVDGKNKYRNSETTGIFIINTGPRKEDLTRNENLITRVIVDIKGGAPYDYTSLYWMTADHPTLSESRFYKTPRFWFKKRLVFYIDADTRELLLVPSVLQGNDFTLGPIRVTKYRIPSM